MRLALIGAGPWASRYAAIMRTMPGVRLAAVVSTRRRQSSFRSPRWVRSLSDLPAAQIDGAIVATSADSHARTATHLLDAGIPVLVEKPMTLDARSARRLHWQARRRGTLLMVAHTHLYSEAFAQLYEALQVSGTTISTLLGQGGNQGPYRQNCSALWDYGSHDMAMFLRLVDARPHRMRVRQEHTDAGGVNTFATFVLPAESPVTVEMQVGSGFELKQRRLVVQGQPRPVSPGLEVQCADRAEFVYDDLATDKVTLRMPGSPAQALRLEGRRLPLERTIAAFVMALRRGHSTHWSARLGVDVCTALQRCERLAATSATA